MNVMGDVDIKSKFLGGMLGSALGDAIGELAFRYPQKEILSIALDQTTQLRYTDDTAMAIGLAESLAQNKGIDQEHLGKTFSDNFHSEPWRGYASGPPSIFSLAKQKGINYRQAARSLFGGQGSLGNGAAMRIAPVGLFYHDSPNLYEHAGASAEVTHAHPVGIDGAAVQAAAVAQAVKLNPRRDFPLEAYLQRLLDLARTPEIHEKLVLVRRLISQEASSQTAADAIGRSVAVHESMPFALYAFLRHLRSFEGCLFCAVSNGGDRDTLGAMACGVSGAYLGIEAIPQAWLDKLENRDYIEHLAILLAEQAKVL